MKFIKPQTISTQNKALRAVFLFVMCMPLLHCSRFETKTESSSNSSSLFHESLDAANDGTKPPLSNPPPASQPPTGEIPPPSQVSVPGVQVLEQTTGLQNNLFRQSIPSTPALDFLVQNVCVDEQDQPIQGDPYSCPRHRNLKIGEDLPYTKSDLSWNKRYMLSNSYPMTHDGRLRVVNSREFGKNSDSRRAFRDFNPLADGYDVNEADGELASIIGTRDPNTNVPNFFWFGSDCQPEDGWVLFRTSITKGVQDRFDAVLKGGTSCSLAQQLGLNMSRSYTAWEWYNGPFTFTSGKVIETLKSFHFGTGDPRKADHIEVFYHTKIYGSTRWERWETESACREIALKTKEDPDKRCTQNGVAEYWNQNKACNGETTMVQFGKTFYRWDCRDFSHVIQLQNPLHPYHTPMHPSYSSARNLLSHSDFAEAQIGPWQRMSPQSTTDWSFSNEEESGNTHLSFSCREKCHGNSIYQDVNLKDRRDRGLQVFQVGALMSAPSPRAVAMLVIHLWGKNSQYYGSMKTRYQFANKSTQNLRYHFGWDFDRYPVETLRFEIYIDTLGVWKVDETFVSITPAN